MKRLTVFLLIVVIMAGLLSTTVYYQVDYNQVALVKTFGSASEPITEPGLHFKWPWPVQRVVYYDTNTHLLEDALNQNKLKDNQNVLLTMYVSWKISDARKFDQNFNSVRRGEETIQGLLETFTGSALGGYGMNDLVNTDPKKMRLKDLENDVRDQFASKGTEDYYGFRILTIGTKSLGVTQDVSNAIIESQKKERERDAEAFRKEGEILANSIRARANADSEQIIAFANRKAELINNEGRLSAAKMYPKFNDAPELSMFLKSLDSLKKELQNRTVMLLDINNLPALRIFVNGPNGVFAAPASRPATAPAVPVQSAQK